MRVVDTFGNIKQVTNVNSLAFGNTVIPLSTSAPSNGQILSYNGTTIGGINQGMTCLAQATASSSATLDFTNLTGYAGYYFILENIIPVTSTGVQMLLRTSTNNGSSYDSGAGNYNFVTNINGSVSGSNSTAMPLSNADVGTATGWNGWVQFNPGTASVHPALTFADWHITNGGAGVYACGSGERGANGPINAVRFLFNSGSISSGTITCFGLNGTTSGTVLAGSATPLNVPGGRLTLTSATPVTTSDVTGAGTIYYTPYVGNRIALYSNGWQMITFSEVSLSLTLTSGKVYDVFGYINGSGLLQLELSAAWNSSTARFASGAFATALPTQDGIWVKSTDGTSIDVTRRYLGTIYASGTNVTADAAATRYLWNAYNRKRRQLYLLAADTSWSCSATSFRQWNANAANQVAIVVGMAEESVQLTLAGFGSGSAYSRFAIGVDSTTTLTQMELTGSTTNGQPMTIPMSHIPSLGYHYYAMLEKVNSGTQTHYGNAPASDLVCGLSGITKA